MANQSIATSVAVPFNFESHTIRAINRDGDIWFVAADVGAVLELTNVRASVALLDDDEKGVNTIDTPSGKQEMSIINESGLYALILRSRKPEAIEDKGNIGLSDETIREIGRACVNALAYRAQIRKGVEK